MALSDLIARVTINPLAASLSRLESQISEADADFQRKASALEALLVDAAVEGKPMDSQEIRKSEESADQAQHRVSNLRRALATARARQSAAQADQERAEKAAHWQKTIKAAETRHVAIQRLEKSMATFAADYTAVLESNDTLKNMLPPSHDAFAILSDRPSLETALRKELVRLGLRWSLGWPWPAADLPSLTPQFDGALSVIRNLAERAKDSL
jgi:hypothetical protein